MMSERRASFSTPGSPGRHPIGDGGRRSRRGRAVAAMIIGLAVAIGAPAAHAEEHEQEEFTQSVARIDRALETNPAGVPTLALEACRNRRNYAMKQYMKRDNVRAWRSLEFCFQALKITHTPPPKVVIQAKLPSMESVQARAAAEIEAALALKPNVERGLEIYRDCAMCHEPEGWGLVAGTTPQIAGQHRSVIIKQLADIRAGNRDAILMLPYASAKAIGGPQAIADVAGYIDSLEMTTANGKGDGDALELGEKLYRRNCRRCHGNSGEGNAEEAVPRIQSQHYNYLLRQFEWIRSGKRRNADPEMAAQIEDFSDEEVRAVLDYVSRLKPPEEITAPEGWHNPDFARVFE